MSPDNSTQQSSPLKSVGKDGASALDRETRRVEDITQSKDRDRSDNEAELTNAERPKRVEQDAAVEAMKRRPEEAGEGSTEPPESRNQDG